MPLLLDFHLEIWLVENDYCLEKGLQDMKVTMHEICGGALAGFEQILAFPTFCPCFSAFSNSILGPN